MIFGSDDLINLSQSSIVCCNKVSLHLHAWVTRVHLYVILYTYIIYISFRIIDMYISYKSRKYLIRAGSGGLGWGPPPPRKIQTHQIHTVKLPKIGLVTPSDKQNYLLEPPPPTSSGKITWYAYVLMLTLKLRGINHIEFYKKVSKALRQIIYYIFLCALYNTWLY